MKEYTNGEIVVVWDPDKCIHAGECVRGLPQVFNREKKPWVSIEGAGTEEIMRVIDRCPSGALTYRKAEVADAAEQPSGRIRVLKNGPLLVEGSCTLIDARGIEDGKAAPFALCRCGGSGKKPFCDGTHTKIGFDDSK
jgi:uncharacterized Fe-S cluster protein YjdI